MQPSQHDTMTLLNTREAHDGAASGSSQCSFIHIILLTLTSLSNQTCSIFFSAPQAEIDVASFCWAVHLLWYLIASVWSIIGKITPAAFAGPHFRQHLLKYPFLAHNCRSEFCQVIKYTQKPEFFTKRSKVMWRFSEICVMANLKCAFASESDSLDYIEAANSNGY